MSTIANVVFADSDDEYDPDFIPEDQSNTSEEEAEQPRPDVVESEAQKAEKEKARAALWESFQASIAGTSSSRNNQQPVKLVKIERKYRFAGEEISEVVEVPEDSDDAKKWPRWIPQFAQGGDSYADVSSPGAPKVETNGTESLATETVPHPPKAPVLATPTEFSKEIRSTNGSKSTAATSTQSAPRPKPGPRKPKTTLAPLPTGKPKKITTLEKSAMDWRAHITQSDSPAENTPGGVSLADELERNRRSGGYLEKVAFLERVGNRREDLFEESRKKRRKG